MALQLSMKEWGQPCQVESGQRGRRSLWKRSCSGRSQRKPVDSSSKRRTSYLSVMTTSTATASSSTSQDSRKSSTLLSLLCIPICYSSSDLKPRRERWPRFQTPCSAIRAGGSGKLMDRILHKKQPGRCSSSFVATRLLNCFEWTTLFRLH